MTVFELRGRITENGNLEVHLPAGQPAGEVTVKIEVPEDWDHQPWTEEELHQLMAPQPKSAAEIAAMLEQMEPIEVVNPELADPTEWILEQRRK